MDDNQTKFSDLKIAIKVQDKDGDIGIITEIEDIHNIYVDLDNGGKAIYCMDKNCDTYENLKIIK